MKSSIDLSLSRHLQSTYLNVMILLMGAFCESVKIQFLKGPCRGICGSSTVQFMYTVHYCTVDHGKIWDHFNNKWISISSYI